MSMPNLDWWRVAERSDLILLRRALKAGTISAEERYVVFAALRERAREKGGRFAHGVEGLVAEFGGE